MKNYNIYLINTETEEIIKEKGLIKDENKNLIKIYSQITNEEALEDLEITKSIVLYQSESELNNIINQLICVKSFLPSLYEEKNMTIKIVKPDGENIKIDLEPSEFDYISEYNFLKELEITQNLISRVQEVIGKITDDIRKETKENKIKVSTCVSHNIFGELERSIMMESILDELEEMITSDYKIISEVGVSIIEFVINEIKKFKTKEEISQIFINGEDFHFNSDTWQIIDKNIASIIRLKIR